MAHVKSLINHALIVLAALVASGSTAPVQASSVPYYHDFLGGVCVREQDLEAAFAAGGKGMRPPPLCLEDPCAETLTRADYSRQILGRDSTDAEWQDYSAMQSLVCAGSQPPDSLIALIPVDYDTETPILTSDPLWATDSVFAPVPAWVDPVTGPSYVDNRDYTRPNAGPEGYWDPFAGFNGSGGTGGSGTSGTGGPLSGPGTGPGGSSDLIPSTSPVPVAPSVLGGVTALLSLVAIRARKSAS